MNINPNNFLSIQNILADALVMLNDEDQKLLTPGYYTAAVKNGLDELGFDISFLPVTTDILLPDDLILTMPVGAFNLTQIHIYSGTPDNVGYVENVYWKKGARTQGKGTGYTADSHHWNVTDPFFYRCNVNEASLYYFSVQNGLIRLSDACAGYTYARLTYDGIPSKNLSTVRMVPPEVREALVLYVVEKGAASIKARDGKYRVIQIDAANQLDRYGLNGAWHLAQDRLVRLDKKMLKDIIEYNSKLNE